LFNVTHQDLAVFQAGHASSPSWKTAESFLRNTDLSCVWFHLPKHEPQ
jgi:hypothetical protein